VKFYNIADLIYTTVEAWNKDLSPLKYDQNVSATHQETYHKYKGHVTSDMKLPGDEIFIAVLSALAVWMT